MPLVLDLPKDTVSIGLTEYIETLSFEKYDFSSQDDLIDSATYLNRLNNNKKFFLQYIMNELKDIVSFQQTNTYNSKAFILHATFDYFLRAVVWKPVSETDKSVGSNEHWTCHDHDFNILTAGYTGPGYRTRCYTYDNSNVEGKLGERVDMKYEGVFTLAEGNLMLYRAKKDIHIQLPPDEVSISLNLIPRGKKILPLQFQFDEQTNQISRYLHASGAELIVRLAGIIGDENYIHLIDSIFHNSHNPLLRAYAANSRIQIAQDLKEETFEWILSDTCPMVKDIFEKEAGTYGSSLSLYKS